MKISYTPNDRMWLFYNKNAYIELAYNIVQYDHIKHVEVNRHFIKEKLQVKIIQFSIVKFKNQLASI